MANTQFNSIIRLRRDNDYNYAKIKDTFIPANGEVCLVDTAREGLRAVCGDGITPFGQLSYIDDRVYRGYFHDGTFYYDIEHTEQVPSVRWAIYLDLIVYQLFCYNGSKFVNVNACVDNATSEKAGITKLYDELGYNTDGTMTQRAITEKFDDIDDELDDKFEIMLDEDNELVIFELNF